MTELQQLLESRAKLWDQMQAILDQAGPTGPDADQRGRYEALEKDLDAQTAQIDLLNRHSAHEAAMSAVDRTGVVAPGAGSDAGGDFEAVYASAFDAWARGGREALTPEQKAVLRDGAMAAGDLKTIRAAQGITTGGAGGYTVPPAFRSRLLEAVKWFGSVRQEAEVITTETGATLPWPTNDDTNNEGALLAENTQVTELDVTFGTEDLDAYTYTSRLVRASLQLLQDGAVNIESWLPRKLGERLGRVTNRHYTVGTGTSQPLGFITGGNAVQAATGNATSYSYETLVDATARLDPAYLQGGNLAWHGSQKALAAVRKLKDGNDRPLWVPSLVGGEPDTLLGYRYSLNNYVPEPAANAKSLAFGDLREGYVIRDVLAVQTLRLDERYADFLQVGFLSFLRTGGTVQNASAYTVVQNSAT